MEYRNIEFKRLNSSVVPTEFMTNDYNGALHWYMDKFGKISSLVFSQICFKDVDFNGLKFIDCHFKTCDFEGSILSNGNFKDCDFRHCLFKNQDVGNITINGSCLEYCVFANISFTSSTLVNNSFNKRNYFSLVKFDECTLRECCFYDHNFKTVRFKHCDFSKSSWISIDNNSSNTRFELCYFGDATISHFGNFSTFVSCEFIDCKSSNLHFKRSYMQNCNFVTSKLKMCKFSECYLNYCSFKDSKLNLSNIWGCHMKNCTFDKVNLSDATISTTSFEGGAIQGCTGEFIAKHDTNFAHVETDFPVFSVTGIGRAKRTTIFMPNNQESIKVLCGCFNGNIEDLKDQVNEKHVDGKFFEQYMAAIAYFKKLEKIERKYGSNKGNAEGD